MEDKERKGAERKFPRYIPDGERTGSGNVIELGLVLVAFAVMVVYLVYVVITSNGRVFH